MPSRAAGFPSFLEFDLSRTTRPAFRFDVASQIGWALSKGIGQPGFALIAIGKLRWSPSGFNHEIRPDEHDYPEQNGRRHRFHLCAAMIAVGLIAAGAVRWANLKRVPHHAVYCTMATQ
jgi:hypothetical protein